MRLLLIVLLIHLFQSDNEVGQRTFPLKLKENLKLNAHHISNSIRLNDSEYILIGKSKNPTIESDGHRLLYLTADSLTERFTLKYISKPKGEAYVYEPYFFELKDELIIVVEEGYEFMSGIDIYRLKNKRVDFLGHIPVSGSDRDSIAEQTEIERKTNNYTISFVGKVEYKAGTDNIVDGSRLLVNIDDNGLRINLK